MNKKELVIKILNMLPFNNVNNVQQTNEESESVFIWEYVILRCGNAWVHFWKLEYAKNWVYRLSESRRLWSWRVKDNKDISLSWLAIYWLDDDNKTCSMIKLIEITEREWWEIIPVNKDALNSFIEAPVYIPN